MITTSKLFLLHLPDEMTVTLLIYSWFYSDSPLLLLFSDQSGEVKLGNPLLVLLQAPSQLLSHLLFDRQVSPDRYTQCLRLIGVNKYASACNCHVMFFSRLDKAVIDCIVLLKSWSIVFQKNALCNQTVTMKN